jgi:hypothetical protein
LVWSTLDTVVGAVALEPSDGPGTTMHSSSPVAKRLDLFVGETQKNATSPLIKQLPRRPGYRHGQT